MSKANLIFHRVMAVFSAAMAVVCLASGVMFASRGDLSGTVLEAVCAALNGACWAYWLRQLQRQRLG